MNAKILLVEDSSDTRTLLQSMFEQNNHSITTCANGLEAMQQLRDHHYDLVVSDVLMPERDGFELSKFIREDLKGNKKDMPIIAMSGGGAQIPQGIALSAMSIHANVILKKTFTTEKFQHAIQTALVA